MPSFIEVRCEIINTTTTTTTTTATSSATETTPTENMPSRLAIPTENYKLWYEDIARLMFFGVIPFLILSVMNLKIFLTIREKRSQPNPETGTRFGAINHGMELELEQAHRSTLIISVYFFFLLFYIIKKCLVMIFFNSNDVPIECMQNPKPILRIAKASSSFAVDFISNVNFFIFIYTGSKFRTILLKKCFTFIEFFKCSNKSMAPKSNSHETQNT